MARETHTATLLPLRACGQHNAVRGQSYAQNYLITSTANPRLTVIVRGDQLEPDGVSLRAAAELRDLIVAAVNERAALREALRCVLACNPEPGRVRFLTEAELAKVRAALALGDGVAP